MIIKSDKIKKPRKKLVENVDFYFENGYKVLTEKYLLERGYCCNKKCKHCPYKKSKKQNEVL